MYLHYAKLCARLNHIMQRFPHYDVLCFNGQTMLLTKRLGFKSFFSGHELRFKIYTCENQGKLSRTTRSTKIYSTVRTSFRSFCTFTFYVLLPSLLAIWRMLSKLFRDLL